MKLMCLTLHLDDLKTIRISWEFEKCVQHVPLQSELLLDDIDLDMINNKFVPF